MKTESVKKNYILNTILRVFLLLIPLITTPYVSRVLGVNKIGDYSFASAMVTYFVLFATLGTSSYGQRQIAYHRDDKESLSIAFWNTFLFRCITSFTALAGYIAYMAFSNNLNAVCIILALNIVDVAFDVTWFYQGIENFRQVVFKNVIIRLISLVLIFVLVKNQNDLWIYAIILCGSSILGNVFIWPSLRKSIIFVKKGINPFANLKDIILIFLPTIAIQIYTVLDKTMIGWITNSSYQNGCYDKAEQIAKISLTVVTSIAAVILPRVSNLFKNNKVDEAKEYVYKAYRFVWLLSIPISFGLFVIAPCFIPLFLGDGYDDAIVLLRVFSPLVIFISLSYVTGLSYLVSTKQQNVYTFAVSIAAFANLVLNLVLIPIISSTGAAIASVCAEFIGCFIQLFYCIHKKQLSIKRIFGHSWKYLVSGTIMALLSFFAGSLISQPITKLIVMILVGVVVYFACLAIIKDSLVLDEIGKVFSKFIKNNKTIAKKQRFSHLDFIKGFCIMLMVCGHAFPTFRSFIYLFHMPAFFMVSGFIFAKKEIRSLKEELFFILKKIIQLYVPFVVFGLLFVLLHNAFLDIGIYSDNPILLELTANAPVRQSLSSYYSNFDILKNVLEVFCFQTTEYLLTASWYLEIIFLIFVVDSFLRFAFRHLLIKKENKIRYLIAILVINLVFLFIIPYIERFSDSVIWSITYSTIRKCNIGYAIFTLGGVFSLFDTQSIFVNKKTNALICFAFSFCFLIALSRIATLEISSGSIVDPFFMLISSFAGWLFLNSLFHILPDKMSNPVRYVGQNTLCILFLHVLSFKVVSYLYLLLTKSNMILLASFHIVFTGSWYMVIAYTFVGIAIPLIVNIPYQLVKKNIKNAVLTCNNEIV